MKYLVLLLLLISPYLTAQIVINELDCDTPSTDTLEFIELKSDTANFALDGFIVVLFNGSTSGGNASYYAIDLAGYTTDINGLLLIGSNNVSPVPQLLIPVSVIQNGADAIAIYQANYNDFPSQTLATTDNLIDALMYDTNDPDDTDLMALLGLTEQINEGENGNQTTESIQRDNDGSYFVTTPTPRQLNDGSGVVLNGVSISLAQEQYNEGESFEILFATEQNVTEALTLNFTLANGTFNTSDYTGAISAVIPIGQNSVSTTINLVDDSDDEGDEIMLVSLASLPASYLILNNNIEIRIVDNDFQVADWGIPTNPTFGIVESTQPANYYTSLDGLTDVELRQAMQDIIADPTLVRAQTYADVVTILKKADQNPANSNQVWLVYTEQGRAKLDFQTTSNNNGKWNREHCFPRSRAGYFSIEADDFADGVNSYWTTNADSLRHGNSDAHALRAADGPENSARGNLHYGQYTGPNGNLGSFKGDVARSVLYMEIRYNGLEIVNGYPNTVGQLGDLATLLDWHRNDPPDDFEMNRNNVVYTWQFNRNPFIDYPDLVEYLWGTHVGSIWHQPSDINEVDTLDFVLYPNPTNNQITISGIDTAYTLEIFSSEARLLTTQNLKDKTSFDLNLKAGLYYVRVSSNQESITRKLMVK
ncbi:MAG TPA: T9SS type A sorting domain-containing protein [Lutibacter sp.]|nr:T9SS type A sorting domain-containing protein [Lutibacter sp.]